MTVNSIGKLLIKICRTIRVKKSVVHLYGSLWISLSGVAYMDPYVSEMTFKSGMKRNYKKPHRGL